MTKTYRLGNLFAVVILILSLPIQNGIAKPSTPVITTYLPLVSDTQPPRLAAGGEFACAVTLDGKVECWGNNDHGQLGDYTTTSRMDPVDAFSFFTATATTISAGAEHTCGLTTNGGVKCTGRNDSGQLGDGTTVDRLIPVDVVGLSSGVTAIAAGGYHTCALTSLGGVMCWGDNQFGELGDSTTINRLTPVDVVGLSSGIVAIAAGTGYTCVLSTADTVICWGLNDHGQLGDGTTTNRPTPVTVVGMPSPAYLIAAGVAHTCVETSASGVQCWGQNDHGQLGDGTTTQRLVPTAVSGLTDGVVGIAAGGSSTCVRAIVGGAFSFNGNSAKCWGANQFGQLGDGSTIDRTAPVDVIGLSSGVITIAVGGEFSCAMRTAGDIQCWGNNITGQLGVGIAYQLTPGDVTGLTSGIAAVAAGGEHSCALTTGGGVKCWGWNLYGQLGDGTLTTRLGPVNVAGLSSEVVAIAAGGSDSCALMNTGGVKCWGLNLGVTDIGAYLLTPVDVTGLTSGVTSITAGGLSPGYVAPGIVSYYNSHNCSITTVGGIRCWGGDSSSQLDGVVLSSKATAVAAGGFYTCAVTTGGAVKCWGANYAGELGDGTTIDRWTPVTPIGLSSNIVNISAGDMHTCVLTTGGGVKCWGANGYGSLGDGTAEDRLSPVDVVGLSSGVAAIVTGDHHSCALTTAGAVKCWGYNGYGQLGDGTMINRLTPVDVTGLNSGVTAISAGWGHTCAVTAGGGVKCWGFNEDGVLGVVPIQMSSTPLTILGYP